MQRRSAPKVSESDVHVICEQALISKRWFKDLISLETDGLNRLYEAVGLACRQH